MLRGWARYVVACPSRSASSAAKTVLQRNTRFVELLGQPADKFKSYLYAKELCKIVECQNDGSALKWLKTKMLKRFKSKYMEVVGALRRVSNDYCYMDMVLYSKIGPKQYFAFVKVLQNIITNDKLSKRKQLEELYRIIRLQHDLFPNASSTRGIVVPDSIHRWFWFNLPKKDSYSHYQFLIENDVFLSSSEYCWKFTRRLMQGSEMELQLVTFQHFLKNGSSTALFIEKFTKLYNFKAMLSLVNRIFERKYFKFSKAYLEALLLGIDSGHVEEGGLGYRFAQYCTTLLHYSVQQQDISLFLTAFEKLMGYLNEVHMNAQLEAIRRKSFILALKLFRLKSSQDVTFKLINTLLHFADSKSGEKFKLKILNELLATLSSFNDPKLAMQYTIAAYQSRRSVRVLNRLGLISASLHGDVRSLSGIQLRREMEGCKNMLGNLFHLRAAPTQPILNVLYSILLSTTVKTLPSAEFKQLLLSLYSRYKKFIKEVSSTEEYWLQNNSIMNLFVLYTRYGLEDDKLAFNLVKDFYEGQAKFYNRNTSNESPFSLVVYGNEQIGQLEILQLLKLMERWNVPLDFKFCTALVLRYLALNDEQRAQYWYQKIAKNGFKINHGALLSAIKEHGWEIPPNFDDSLLQSVTKKRPFIPRFVRENEMLGDEDDAELNSFDTNTSTETFDRIIDLINSVKS